MHIRGHSSCIGEAAAKLRNTLLDQDILTKAAVENIYARPTNQDIVPVTAQEVVGALPAGGAQRIAANPAAEGGTGDEALDAAAMEFGTD